MRKEYLSIYIYVCHDNKFPPLEIRIRLSFNISLSLLMVSVLCSTIITFDLIISMMLARIAITMEFFFSPYSCGSSSFLFCFLLKMVRAMLFSRFFPIIIMSVDSFNRTCRHVMNVSSSVDIYIYIHTLLLSL